MKQITQFFGRWEPDFKVIFERVQKSFFLTLFYGILYYFSETLTEVVVRKMIYKWLHWNLRKKWWEVSMLVTIFINDECARPPTLLKTESTTDILIGQVDKFQNSCFKEHLWKVAAAQKACILRACHEICSRKHWM